MADDLTYLDMPLHGGEQVETPNIDRLAEDGLTFDRAYVSEAMCKPSRAALYTGMYPVRTGVVWNHAPTRKGTRGFTHYLEQLGYRVGLAGKKHIDLPFTRVGGVTGGAVAREATFSSDEIKDFLSDEKQRPFCLVTAFTLPHGPWTEGNPDQFNPDQLSLPPYLVSTEKTREQYAKYLAEIEVLDQQMGRLLDVLEKMGQEEDTLVLFTSEQGSAFPGAKWTCWNPGVHTSLVVRWPRRVDGGQRTDALVQYVDVLPTLMEVAGGDPEKHDFDGKSFLPVLLGNRDEHREYAYFMHNNVPEGPPFPIRGVTDGEYHYIRNLTPERSYLEKHIASGEYAHTYWFSWVKKASTGSKRAIDRLQRFISRPAEELYYIPDDPHNMRNLANDSSHDARRQRLSRQLDTWMKEQGDPGREIDTVRQWKKARNKEHFQPDSGSAE
jgi:uncharacterized sulfatase